MRPEPEVQMSKLQRSTSKFGIGDSPRKLAILTESLRRDNHAPLRFFKRLQVVHFYGRAPYKDMTKEEFAGAERYWGLLDLYRQLLRFRPSIIQGSEPYASRRSLLLSLIALIASRRLNVPLIFPSLENVPPRERFGPVIGAIVERYFGLYAGGAKCILALNNGAASNLRAAGVPENKIIRFPWGIWGVDRTVFRPTKRTPKAVFRQPTILFVGRLDPEKGVMDLLQAFALIAPNYSDWRLVLIGRGMLEEEIVTFIKANHLEERIHRLGWIPNRELPPYYSSARVTVYPSVATKRGEDAGIQGWSEQVGTVILQSLACGTPVVATRSGAIPEYLPENCGLLVPEHDPDSLAQALERIMNNESLRARLSRNGEKYIAERFDAKANVEKAEEMVMQWLHNATNRH